MAALFAVESVTRDKSFWSGRRNVTKFAKGVLQQKPNSQKNSHIV